MESMPSRLKRYRTEGHHHVGDYKDSVMGTWAFNYDNLNRLAGAQAAQPGNSFTNYCWSYDG